MNLSNPLIFLKKELLSQSDWKDLGSTLYIHQ